MKIFYHKLGAEHFFIMLFFFFLTKAVFSEKTTKNQSWSWYDNFSGEEASTAKDK